MRIKEFSYFKAMVILATPITILTILTVCALLATPDTKNKYWAGLILMFYGPGSILTTLRSACIHNRSTRFDNSM